MISKTPRLQLDDDIEAFVCNPVSLQKNNPPPEPHNQQKHVAVIVDSTVTRLTASTYYMLRKVGKEIALLKSKDSVGSRPLTPPFPPFFRVNSKTRVMLNVPSTLLRERNYMMSEPLPELPPHQVSSSAASPIAAFLSNLKRSTCATSVEIVADSSPSHPYCCHRLKGGAAKSSSAGPSSSAGKEQQPQLLSMSSSSLSSSSSSSASASSNIEILKNVRWEQDSSSRGTSSWIPRAGGGGGIRVFGTQTGPRAAVRETTRPVTRDCPVCPMRRRSVEDFAVDDGVWGDGSDADVDGDFDGKEEASSDGATQLATLRTQQDETHELDRGRGRFHPSQASHQQQPLTVHSMAGAGDDVQSYNAPSPPMPVSPEKLTKETRSNPTTTSQSSGCRLPAYWLALQAVQERYATNRGGCGSSTTVDQSERESASERCSNSNSNTTTSPQDLTPCKSCNGWR